MTTSQPAYAHLFEEGRIKDLVIKNRLVQPSMCDNMSTARAV